MTLWVILGNLLRTLLKSLLDAQAPSGGTCYPSTTCRNLVPRGKSTFLILFHFFIPPGLQLIGCKEARYWFSFCFSSYIFSFHLDTLSCQFWELLLLARIFRHVSANSKWRIPAIKWKWVIGCMQEATIATTCTEIRSLFQENILCIIIIIK